MAFSDIFQVLFIFKNRISYFQQDSEKTEYFIAYVKSFPQEFAKPCLFQFHTVK